MNKTYWISFASNWMGNLGCCIIDAKNKKAALKKTLKLKINPGGQAMFFELPANRYAEEEINKWGKNKLITPSDLMNDGYKKLKDLSPEMQDKIGSHEGVSFVCEKHNK